MMYATYSQMIEKQLHGYLDTDRHRDRQSDRERRKGERDRKGIRKGEKETHNW